MESPTHKTHLLEPLLSRLPIDDIPNSVKILRLAVLILETIKKTHAISHHILQSPLFHTRSHQGKNLGKDEEEK